MKTLQLTLLGGFEARLSGQVADVRSNKAKAILAYLALTPGKSHSRGELVALLWSDRGEEQARHSLRQELSVLRRALGEDSEPTLIVERDGIALDPTGVDVDVVLFEQGVAEGTPEALEHAVGLYRGEFLAGVDVRDRAFEEWLRYEREHLHELAVESHVKCLSQQVQEEGGDGSTTTARRLLELDPLNERAHRLLMQAYAERDERRLALKHYEHFLTLLQEELGSKPEAETEQLYAAIRGADHPPEPRDQPGSNEPALVDPASNVPPVAAVPLPRRSLSGRPRSWLIGALGTGLIVVCGVVALVLWPAWQSPPSSKPSIAVLPFDNLSADPEQDYFADGMTDDLITQLSKISGLLTIARNSTLTYKGTAMDVRQVAEDLGVRYTLQGSVRRVEDRIRINAQLTDTESGNHIWAESYDGSLVDVFALQDKVTQNVVTALAVKLSTEEQAQKAQQDTDNPEAYDAFLRGRAYVNLLSPEEYDEAVESLEKAIQLDPSYTRAHAWLAAVYWYVWDDWEGYLGITGDEAMQKLEHHLHEALKDPTPMAHRVAARVLTSKLRYDEAITEAERGIALDPGDAAGYQGLARVLNKAGRPAESLEVTQKVLRLNPRGDDLGGYSYRMGESYYLLGRYEEAAEMFLRSMNRSGEEEWGALVLGMTYGQLGREQEAKALIAKFDEGRATRGFRPYTLAHFDAWSMVPSVRERYREGLRKAGMPPGASSSPVLAGVYVAPAEVEGATTIDTAQAKALLDQAVPFIDVRSDRQWQAGHIPGAMQLHLYHDFSETKLSEIVPKDREVVIYAGGLRSRRSGAAAARAVSWGFGKAYFFREGFPGWRDDGYPVEAPPG